MYRRLQDSIQQEYRGRLWAGNIHSIAVPAMPVVIAEVVEILDAPFPGAATIVNICVVVLALVVYITAVIVGSPFSIPKIDIASCVQRTNRDYICVCDIVCDWRDVAGSVDLNKVVRYCRTLLENPEAFGCGKVVFTVIPQKVIILLKMNKAE